MLTPMLVQYLVGLCCLHRNSQAVDVTIGDLVLDVAAQKVRDVDVTVTIQESDHVRAFKAYEVKREGEPLDVATVEQLCIKLRDMPSITHRAVVSSSGFTDGAIAKAKAHDVELFVVRPWTRPMAEQFEKFVGVGRPEEFFSQFYSTLLYWVDSSLHLIAPDGPGSFRWDDSTQVFAVDGRPHEKFPRLSDFKDLLLLRSTEILCTLEPAQTVLRNFRPEQGRDSKETEVSEAWSHSHTVDVRDDQVFLKLDGTLAQVTSATITGYLQWQRQRRRPEFYIVEKVVTGEPFAGAAVADLGSPDGKMVAFVFAPDSRDVRIESIMLQPKHKNAIRQLKLIQQTGRAADR